MALNAEDPEIIAGWQESLNRFDQFIWPLFHHRGYTKDAAYLFWTLNRLINTIETLPIDFVQESKNTDDDGDEWKRQ